MPGAPNALQSECRSEETESRYREILDNLTDIVQCYDAKGRLLYISPSFQRLSGREPSVTVRSELNAMDLIHPDDRQAVRDAHKKLKSMDSVSLRFRTIAKDGTTGWHESTIRALRRDESNHVLETVVVSHDITEQVEAEQALRDSEYEFRQILQNISDVVLRLDGNMRCLYASPSIRDVMGIEPSKIVGAVISPTGVHPDDRESATLINQRLFSDGQPRTFTFRAVNARTRSTVWIEANARPMRWHADGRVAEVLVVSRDITARKEVEDALEGALKRAETASAAKSMFLASMSHELRTPLNAILGFSEVIRSEVFGPLQPDRYKEYVDLIHGSGGQLLELIEDVLQLSKVDAGKTEPRIEPVDLRELLVAALRTVSVRAQKGELTLNAEVSQDLPTIEADRRSVLQIVLNLLTNAIKFTQAGGAVTLSAKRQAEMIVIEVRDTGVGIGPADLKRLTMPFEQVRQDSYVAHEGAGLGLALVRSLVDLHHGTLALESTVGEGTVVTVSLPCRQLAQRMA